ncbi:MAG: metallophosphoesterase, partial [Devosiaceae bacterium]|nr:metallophosphoesterase [Devosiaceae bacterium]
MSKIWFTADTHFGHQNIIKYSNRPFADVKEMDAALIENWNARVKKGDIVYHLGDVGLCAPEKLRKILDSLHGHIR